MVRIKIALDERYPLFLVDNDHGSPIDVDSDTLDRWRRVMAEFEAVQDEIDAELRKVPGYTTENGLWRI